MGIFSAIKRQQCLKEYHKELAAQNYTFEQWKEAQPAFHMTEEHARAAVLYADYIRWESASDGDQMPVFLPDFGPNRWDYEDYLGESVFIREDLYHAVDWENTSRRTGLKRVIELAEKSDDERTEQTRQVWDKEYKAVVHIRGLLTKAPAGFVKLEKRPGKGCFEATGTEQLEEAYGQGISIIIPSKDHPEILQKCLASVQETTEQIPLEIIIVDNGSCKQSKAMVTSLCKKVTDATRGRIRCQYIYEPMDFHFSKMCNLGAAKATGAYLLFLNDDIEAVEKGWLTDMLAEAIKPYTGAVGMKLLYPDGKRIQHAGIVNLPMGPVHKLQFGEDTETYYDRRNRGVYNVSAVTGACLMMRKELFEKLGGMSKELPVAFNDVELCFQAMEQGYYNVICCNKYLLHHESISRGQDNTEEKRSRLLRERSKLYEMHPKQISFDPFYPYDVKTGYGLCHAYLDTAIRPAYEDGLPLVQEINTLQEIDRGKAKQSFPQRPEHEKLNPCLKVQVEQLYQDQQEYIHVAGYSFVVGSDNSQFTYTLILRGEDKSYVVPLKPLRRNDLERNMPDQINVGLAGFHVMFPRQALAEGRYRMEIYARNRASSLRLRQSSNVIMQIR